MTLQQSYSMEVGETVESRDPDGDVLIECRNVFKTFSEKQVLKGASFKVSPEVLPSVPAQMFGLHQEVACIWLVIGCSSGC